MVRRRRNLFHFGLRSILVLTTVVAVFCGAWLREVQVQRDVCDRLVALEIEVKLDPPPEWLSWLPKSVLSLGDGHYFCPVTEVELHSKSGSDLDQTRHDNDLLFLVSRLPRLQRLRIDDALVDPKDFQLLARFRRLTELDLGYGKLLDEDLALIPKLPRLQSLDLSANPRLTGMHINADRFPSLEHLYLQSTSLSDESLAEIGRMETLKSLEMAFTPISDVGIGALSSLKQLVTLDVESTRVSGIGVGALQSLERVDLSDTRLKDAAFPEIRKLEKLQGLTFQRCPFVTDEGVRCLAHHPALENIQATDCGLTDACTDSLATIAALEYLWLDDTCIRSLGKLANCKKLKSLSISSAEVPIEDALRFANHEQFELFIENPSGEVQPNSEWSCFGSRYGNVNSVTSGELCSMDGKRIGGNQEALFWDGLVGLQAKHLRNLTYDVRDISLERSKADTDFYRELVDWPLLVRLDLSGAALSEQDLAAVGSLTRLESLELDLTDVDDASLQHIASLTNLSTLDLGQTKITAESLHTLGRYTQLESLTIPFMPDAAWLIDLLRSCPSLNSVTVREPNSTSAFDVVDYDTLNLFDIDITPDQLGQLRAVTFSSQSPFFTNFAGRRINDEHCVRLANFPEFTSIDVSGSAVTDVGIAELAKLSALEQLDVSNTGVTPAGLQAFKSHKELQSLTCTSRDWSAEDVEALFELKSLTSLCLSFSEMPREVTQVFLEKYIENEWLSWHEGGSDYSDVDYFCDETDVRWLSGQAPFESNKLTLTLVGSMIDDAKIAELVGSPAVGAIWVQNVRCDSEALFAKLLECTNARILTLRGLAFAPADVERLGALRMLESLTIADCKLTNEHLTKLAQLENISTLYVARTDFNAVEFVGAIKASSIQKVMLRADEQAFDVEFLQSQLGKRIELSVRQ